MTSYVLILSLGPVQGFIAAARRSRDLWCGSWLLSEISKAAAATLAQEGATLIFPAPTQEGDLLPGSAFSVGNKVQALVKTEDAEKVRRLAILSADAARQRFREIAEKARSKLAGDVDLREKVWALQVDDYVESFAAWARVIDGNYAAAADRASALLAARKATRNFAPSAQSADDPLLCLPKSSLDGARETVLGSGISKIARRKLGLSEGEQLDCAGIVKRLGDVEQFTPFSRIAAHSWIESLDKETRSAMVNAYEPLVRLGLATRVKGNGGIYADFPFDAQLCFRFRFEASLNDAKQDLEAKQALNALRVVLAKAWATYGEPCSYGVLLVADGDKMGALLSEVKGLEAHMSITRKLSAFAGTVMTRVRQFAGHAIYAGGDDVLAFLPLNQAYACADALRLDFANELQPLAKSLSATNLPTLSVGLAIGHILEPLGDLRVLASVAEKKAKGDDCGELKRDALGVSLGIRSGAKISVRLRWSDNDAHATFKRWIDAYQKRELPSRVAYDTRAVHLRTAFSLQQGAVSGLQLAEFNRMLDRARTSGGERMGSESKKRLSERGSEIGLANLADELIVARWLAARLDRDLGDER